MRAIFQNKPFLIAGTYLLLGGLWILSSDYLVSVMFGQNAELLQWAQRFKGLFFVLSTALLLYFLVERFYARIIWEKKDLDTLYQNPDLGLLKLDRSGRIRFISPRLEESLGFQPNTLQKEFFQSLAAPQGKKEVKRILSYEPKSSLEDSLSLEIPLLNKEGKPQWYRLQCHFPLHNNALNRVVASLHDVTAHHVYRRQLATELQEKNALINASPDAIWSYDHQFNLLSGNEAFYENYQSLTNHPIAPGEFLLSQADSATLERFWRLLYRKPLNGKSLEKTLPSLLKQTFSIRLFPLYDHLGNIKGGVCYAHNISERLRYLDRLEKQNKRLRQIAWMQSHLVRAPLARIQGLIRLLPLEAPQLSADHGELLEKIDLSTQELDQVIRDISANTATDDPKHPSQEK